MSSSRNVVYALSLDSKTHRYVGLTARGVDTRLGEHVKAALSNSQLPVHQWMRKHGPLSVKASVLQSVDDYHVLAEIEVMWIKKLRTDGFSLLNLTHGGEQGVLNRGTLAVGYIEPATDIDRASNSLVSYHNELVDQILRGDNVKLQAYAASNSKDSTRKRCMTCALDGDILKQIHEARDKTAGAPTVPFTLISQWLEAETGKKIQPATIRNHFVAGHHND